MEEKTMERKYNVCACIEEATKMILMNRIV